MPPKKKRAGSPDTAGGRKKGAKGDAVPQESTEEAEKQKRLAEELRELNSSCEKEERLCRELQAEKEQIHHLWTLEHTAIEAKQDLLRKKKSDLLDETESFSMQLKLCKLRVKQLLAEQAEEEARLKLDVEAALKLREDVHREKEQNKKQAQRTQADLNAETQGARDAFVLQLCLLQDEKVLKLRKKFQRSAQDLYQKWKLRLENLREDMQKKRQEALFKLEGTKNAHVLIVQSQNTNRAQAIKRYYGDVASSNLEIIKQLKKEHANLRREELREGKRMADLIAKNRGLVEPLKRITQETEKLQQELRLYEAEKAKLAEAKQKLAEQSNTLRRLEQQAEINEQQMDAFQKTKESLQRKYQMAVYELQRKACQKTMILEREIDALQEAAELAVAQVKGLEGQLAGGKCQAAGSIGTFEDIAKAKDQLVEELQCTIRSVKQLQETAVAQLLGCMAGSGVAVDDLGFVLKEHACRKEPPCPLQLIQSNPGNFQHWSW